MTREGSMLWLAVKFLQYGPTASRAECPFEGEEDAMTKAKSPIPEGFRSLTQYLILDNAAGFLKFIESAFAATERFLMRDDDGIIRHAEAQLGECAIEFAEASGQWKAMPAGLHYY